MTSRTKSWGQEARDLSAAAGIGARRLGRALQLGLSPNRVQLAGLACIHTSVFLAFGVVITLAAVGATLVIGGALREAGRL